MNCTLCPRNCNIDRSKTKGFCNQNENLSVARAALHLWEEPIICTGVGSGAIFFAGCNLRCVYCQNFEVSRGKGKQITTKRLADIFKELEDKGACNINLITPTHFVPQIVDAFELYKPALPIVYNCGGYESEKTLDLLNGIIDIYLPDFKYSDNDLAKRLSNVDDYFEIACNAIKTMRKQVGKDIIINSTVNQNIIKDMIIDDTTNKDTEKTTILDSITNQNIDNNIMIDYSVNQNNYLFNNKISPTKTRPAPNEILPQQNCNIFSSSSVMKKGMIIRHLVLPNHLDNTFGVLEYFANNLNLDSIISLMGQYIPCGIAFQFNDINRPLKPIEYKLAINRLEKYGFQNAYIQELSSSDKIYIPPFDFEGV